MTASLLCTVLALAGSAEARRSADPCVRRGYDCAALHVARGEFEPAIAILEPLVKQSPRDLKALNLLGIALTGAGRRGAANACFRQALVLEPRFYPALKNLAINEYDAADLAAARRDFERVLKLAPADEVAHLYLAELDYRAGRRTEALAHYASSGGRYAERPASTLQYARCLIEARRTKEAAAVLSRLPKDVGQTLFEAGVALGHAGAHADAARFFGMARRSLADPYAAGYNEALMLVESGNAEGAIRVVAELGASGRTTAELLNLESRALLAAGRIQDAYDALRRAARLEPGAANNYIDLAAICLEHENLDLGLEIADIGLSKRPDSWMLHVLRGVLLAMKARIGEAEAAFDAARRLAPSEPVPYAALGMAWMQSGQAQKAVEVLRGERTRAGDHVVPYIFAVALLRSGVEPASPAAAEAVDALRDSIRAKPDFAPARSELGRLLFRRKEVDAAIAELERAAELDPGGAAALYTLSQAYRDRGERDKAQALLARVNRLNAAERGGDADNELRRAVFRIVREGAPAPARPTLQP